MPTRIVFSNAASPSPRSPEPDTQQFPDRATFFAVEPFGNRSLDHNHSVREQAGTKPQSNSRLSYSTPPGSRRVVTFGHSILREFALRSSDEGVNETRALTSDDIRASPRFVGYLFSMIAAAVQLVSVVQYVNSGISIHRLIRCRFLSLVMYASTGFIVKIPWFRKNDLPWTTTFILSPQAEVSYTGGSFGEPSTLDRSE